MNRRNPLPHGRKAVGDMTGGRERSIRGRAPDYGREVAGSNPAVPLHAVCRRRGNVEANRLETHCNGRKTVRDDGEVVELEKRLLARRGFDSRPPTLGFVEGS